MLANFESPEAATRGVLCKKVFLEIQSYLSIKDWN